MSINPKHNINHNLNITAITTYWAYKTASQNIITHTHSNYATKQHSHEHLKYTIIIQCNSPTTTTIKFKKKTNNNPYNNATYLPTTIAAANHNIISSYFISYFCNINQFTRTQPHHIVHIRTTNHTHPRTSAPKRNEKSYTANITPTASIFSNPVRNKFKVTQTFNIIHLNTFPTTTRHCGFIICALIHNPPTYPATQRYQAALTLKASKHNTLQLAFNNAVCKALHPNLWRHQINASAPHSSKSTGSLTVTTPLRLPKHLARKQAALNPYIYNNSRKRCHGQHLHNISHYTSNFINKRLNNSKQVNEQHPNHEN
eukprot:gene2404-1507_t